MHVLEAIPTVDATEDEQFTHNQIFNDPEVEAAMLNRTYIYYNYLDSEPDKAERYDDFVKRFYTTQLNWSEDLYEAMRNRANDTYIYRDQVLGGDQ